MEEFRPLIVDAMVLNALNKEKLTPDNFSCEAIDLLQKSDVKCDRELVRAEKYGLRNSQKPESRKIQTPMWSKSRDFRAHG